MSRCSDNKFQCWKEKKAHGYNRNLYRNKRDGKIFGVCAGIADHLNMDHWVMRVLVLGSFFILGPLTFWAYITGAIVLSKRPEQWTPETEYDEERGHFREKTIFKHSKPAPQRLRVAREKMDMALKRIEKIERYVTSSRYDLDKQFADMERGK
ncbi:PspC domain-containing protein [Sessilibacter sp. MAH2]